MVWRRWTANDFTKQLLQSQGIKMKRLFLAAAACFPLALAACATPGSTSMSLDEAAVLAEAQSGEPMICARERITGTRLGEIVCRTAAEIEAERERSQDYARQRNSNMRDGTRGPRDLGPGR